MKRIALYILPILFCLLLPCRVSAEERVVLTIGDKRDRSDNRYDGENQLGLWQYLEDQLNVEIRYVHMSQASYDFAMSSGNLPDIVTTDNNLSAIMEKGIALDLDPYLREYVPNFLEGDTKLAYDVYKKLLNKGEGFYFFPCRIGHNGTGFSNKSDKSGYVVRWDYYKELGYPPIHNDEDYLNVLLQMYERHPFTEEGYPTYLYGTDNLKGFDTAFRAGVDLDYWAAYKYQNNIFTNEVFDGYTDPEHSMWWTSMEFFNKLYRAGKAKGSFDMEIFTQTEQQYKVKCTRGQYLGLHGLKNELYNEKVKTDPDTLSGYCRVPTAANNYYSNVYQVLGNGSAYMWFISANSPNKEAALKLFNYMCDPYFLREVCLGRQGVTWDYDADGVPRMTEYGQAQLDAYRKGKASSDNYFVKWGSFKDLPNNWPILRDNVMHPDGYPLDFVTITREYAINTMTSNLSRDLCSHYNVELPTDALYKDGGLDFRNDCGEAISSTISSMERDQLQIIKSAEEILENVRVDLILAETDEEWNRLKDQTITRMIDLGEPEVFKAYQEKWDAAAAVIVPIVNKIQSESGIEPYTPEDYERQLR